MTFFHNGKRTDLETARDIFMEYEMYRGMDSLEAESIWDERHEESARELILDSGVEIIVD